MSIQNNLSEKDVLVIRIALELDLNEQLYRCGQIPKNLYRDAKQSLERDALEGSDQYGRL